MVWNRGGWVGVDLFFVLSGFLVSGLLFQEFEKHGRVSGWHFLIRRGLKIYPMFWVLVAATVLVAIRRHNTITGHQIAAELLFFQNYSRGIWWHTWSLAVEEHFYFALTGIVVLLSALGPRGSQFRVTPLLFASVAVVCLTARLLTRSTSFDEYSSLFPTHLRVDSLFFGVLLAYAATRHPVEFETFARRFRLPLLCVVPLFLLPAFLWPLETWFVHTVGLTLFYLGSGCLLVGVMAIDMPKSGFPSWIAFIGSRSYSIYLWHPTILLWVLPVLALAFKRVWYWPVYLPVYVLGSLGLGVVMSAFIEYPALRMRERLFPSRG